MTETVCIERDYRDAWGNWRRAPDSTVARLEAVLGRKATVCADDANHLEPRKCYEPEWMRRGERRWGIAAQLYSLRSARNWGIGDFSDLKRLIVRAAEAGADFIGVNPLHALYAADARRFSPYSPSSREFLNVLYIDPTAMQAFAVAPEAQRHVASEAFAHRLAALRAASAIDYVDVAACKDAVFRLIFAAFSSLSARQPKHPIVSDYRQFVAARGDALKQFAIYQALSCQPSFGPNWMTWPSDYHEANGAAAGAFADANAADVSYHQFLQWEADRQLAACGIRAKQSGMAIGLYLDYAVGTPPDSAEAWSERANIISGFYIGAPPDAWNHLGQDWGLAPYDPEALARTDFAAFRRIFSAIARHAGMVRIDHILGFQRLFLVPAGELPLDGVYIRPRTTQLFNALAAESERQGTIVIGEDLGTVPEGFPAVLAGHNILSSRVLIFAKDNERFLAPAEYPPNALVTFSTHDLPTLIGYWCGIDLDLRDRLRLYPDNDMRERAIAERARDRVALPAALRAAGFPDCNDAAGLLVPAHRFMARTPCQVFAVQMEDLAMERSQPNLPGSDDRYPSWRCRLTRDLDAIFADPRAISMLAAIRAERPRRAAEW